MASIGVLYAVGAAIACVSFTLGCVMRALFVRTARNDATSIILRLQASAHDVELGDDETSDEQHYDARSIVSVSNVLLHEQRQHERQHAQSQSNALVQTFDSETVRLAVEQAIMKQSGAHAKRH